MKKYQILICRGLKGFGQFVTESRDETNTFEFGPDDERPVIFGEKLKAVERRTIMRKVREVLGVNCWLRTHKKGADSGISGLCMSCPACALFGGTYAPAKRGPAGAKNVVEMRRIFYTAAFPFVGGGIRDVTFNAVDERTGQTGQAMGTNQIIEPRDFIDVVTVEANGDDWVKLAVWAIEHTDRYGANTRIYGEIHNTVLGVVEDTRLRVAAIDLARQSSILEDLGKREITLTSLSCDDQEINRVIRDLALSPEVNDLARRKNHVDLMVDEYFLAVKERFSAKGTAQEGSKAPVEKRTKDAATNGGIKAKVKGSIEQRLRDLSPLLEPALTKVAERLGKEARKSEYALARAIEEAIFPEVVEEEEADQPAATK